MTIKKDHEEELAEPDCQMGVLAHCERSVSGFGGWVVPALRHDITPHARLLFHEHSWWCGTPNLPVGLPTSVR